MTKKYVLGFAFNLEGGVLLIEKNKPLWMQGKLNGIGGKVEGGESPADAMDRESGEEVSLRKLPWQCKGIMKGKNPDGEEFEVWVFYAFSPRVNGYMRSEEEIPAIYSTASISLLHTMANVPALIHLGLRDNSLKFFELNY